MCRHLNFAILSIWSIRRKKKLKLLFLHSGQQSSPVQLEQLQSHCVICTTELTGGHWHLMTSLCHALQNLLFSRFPGTRSLSSRATHSHGEAKAQPRSDAKGRTVGPGSAACKHSAKHQLLGVKKNPQTVSDSLELPH